MTTRKTRKTLSDAGVRALKVRTKMYNDPDPELRGHYVRVLPSGTKSFCAVAVNPNSRKQVWATVGACDAMSVDQARDKARGILARVRAGLPPVEVKGETFGQVADNWLKRHVEAKGLRTEKEIRRILDTMIRPKWQDREFVSIRRGDVAALLDKVEDHHGARTADTVLAVLRSISNWHQSRSEDYASPIVKGMRRQSPRARDRVLSDDEIRSLWQATETGGVFDSMVRMLLLTAQRRAKVITMRWSDVDDWGAWAIATEAREKTNPIHLLLPEPALRLLCDVPEVNDFVFFGRSDGHFNGLSKAKRVLDAKLPKDMPPWVLHDLRRTARSLMSRAGIRPDISERVLGHAIAGVEGVYDRHAYGDEKRDALERLAALIMSIVNPPASDNVLPLPVRRRR